MYIVTIREVRPVVTAATLLPTECRSGYQATHRQDAGGPPVVWIERLMSLESHVEILPRRLEHSQRARQPVTIPEQTDVLPHDA